MWARSICKKLKLFFSANWLCQHAHRALAHVRSTGRFTTPLSSLPVCEKVLECYCCEKSVQSSKAKFQKKWVSVFCNLVLPTCTSCASVRSKIPVASLRCQQVLLLAKQCPTATAVSKAFKWAKPNCKKLKLKLLSKNRTSKFCNTALPIIAQVSLVHTW